MARKKTTLVRTIRMLSIIPFAVLAAVISISLIISHDRIARQRAQRMRVDYVTAQKVLIKREVQRVVNLVRTTKSRNREKVNQTLKNRVYEAHTIAHNIYRTYRGVKTDVEIQKMIICAIRPIRYWQGIGYYFIAQHDGLMVLNADKPTLEGKYLRIKDSPKRTSVMSKVLAVARNAGEGYASYKWTKPGGTGAGFQKTTFVKQFKPYNWVIGTGLYAEDIEARLKRELLQDISEIRFGKEGYIFVNRLNGDALASNGKITRPVKKLWEVSNKTPEETKKVFALEYQAAQNPQGDYIYYSWEKLTTTKTKSPKASFIYGLPELGWLIGAGVYLDDVESTISQLQRRSTRKLRKELLLILLFTIGLISLMLLVVHRIGGYLLGDVQLFVSFLSGAARSNTKIDTSDIRFEELANIGTDANTMLADKIAAEEKVLREKEQLAVTLRSIGDGVITTDLQGRIVLINRITEDLTGWTQSEALDRPVEDVFRIVNEQTGQVCVNPVTEVIATGKKVDLATPTALVARDGTKRIIEDTAAPICDKDNNVSGAVLVYRDVTAERRTATELLKIEKLESVGVLAGGLAHDFNNILGAILGNIELAVGRTEKDTEIHSLLVDAHKASIRAIGITQQLLAQFHFLWVASAPEPMPRHPSAAIS